MDIGQEITNHLEWMETVASLLGSEEITEEELQTISQHDKCKLGQWLDSGDSVNFRDFPEFEMLKESHEEFHKLAGKLIVALQHDNEAEVIETGTQFIETSQKIIGYLRDMQ